MFYIEVKKL